MRLILLCCAVAMSGCGLAELAVMGVIALPAAAGASASRADEADLERRIRLSRDEAIDRLDDLSQPVCHVTTQRLRGHSWKLHTCQETLLCQPQGEEGYRCRVTRG